MSSSTRQKSVTNNDIANYNLQGVEAENVIAGNGNTINKTETDHGSVKAAFELGGKALEMSDRAGDRMSGLAESAMTTVADLSSDSMDRFGDLAQSSMSMMGQVAAQQSASSREQTKAMTELAKVTATNNKGNTEDLKKWLIVAGGVVGLGFVLSLGMRKG